VLGTYKGTERRTAARRPLRGLRRFRSSRFTQPNEVS
jgi:hypothetical protein